MKFTQNKKICIITQSHLSRNPRVVKEASSLAKAGYQVTIINSTYDKLLTIEDKELIAGQKIELISVSQLENNNQSSFGDRLFKRIGDNLVRYFKIQTSMALGYAALRYKKIALKQNADLYICHQELGLYCGVQLLHLKKKVAFDFEDWYSEDLLDVARAFRPIELLNNSEKIALQKGAFTTTTSHVLAKELAKNYDSNKPETIYNTFDVDEDILSRPKSFDQPLKLLWFSQTIGPGRGLEKFLQMIAKVDTRVEIHLLGKVDDGYKTQLLAIQNTHPVFFQPLVPASQLAVRIADFDIGLALEEFYPISRNLTITNKFFQYIQSGLPVIATATLGQLEIFDKTAPGFLIDNYESTDLIKKLGTWLKNKEKLHEANKIAVKLAREYKQDTQYAKLLKLVDHAL